MKKEKRTRKIIAVQKLETHGCSGAFKKVSEKNLCHKVTTNRPEITYWLSYIIARLRLAFFEARMLLFPHLQKHRINKNCKNLTTTDLRLPIGYQDSR